MMTWKFNKETKEYQSSAKTYIDGVGNAPKYTIIKCREKRFSNQETWRLYTTTKGLTDMVVGIKSLNKAMLMAEEDYNEICKNRFSDFDRAMQIGR